ncbi:MAG: DUF998 domain-containing protein [Spirochaetales bacterium]|nr:DUF998 domain-containing protein [Spirochaetales bacterium]
MEKRSAENWLCLAGVLAGVLYFLHVILGALHYPGYNGLAQAVSDLTATDSPSYMIASRFSGLYGALACLGCTLVWLLVRRGSSRLLKTGMLVYMIMNWISFIGYSLFPLSGKGFQGTVQDVFHFYIVTIAVVITAIASLLLIIIGGLKSRNSKWLGFCAAAALLSMLAGSVGVGLVPPGCFGLAERFSTYSAVIFTMILGIYGFLFSRARSA